MANGAATGVRQRIFISYRREETSAHAGRIYDAMVARFGEDNVFMDVEMAPGVDFVERITNVVSGCTVLIAVMGRSWAQTPGPDGRPRLQDEADFVRLEVGAAIQNPDVTVIPALVDRAQMPKAEQLPAEMQPLARRNALELSDGRWRYDVGRLNETLEHLLEGLTGVPAQVQPEPLTPAAATAAPTPAAIRTPAQSAPPAGRSYEFAEAARLVVEGVLVAAIAALVGRLLVDKVPESETAASEIAAVVMRRAGAWGLTGLALALWLGLRTRRPDLFRLGVLGLVVGAVAGAIGGAVWGLPVKLPSEEVAKSAEQSWEVLATAVTAGLIGALLGTIWRPSRLFAGLLAGALSGALIQLFVNGAGPSGKEIPEIGYAFGLRAGFVAGVTLAVLLALSASRSSAAAREPGSR